MTDTGTKDDPWELVTAPGSSNYTMYIDGDELVCQVGSTTLKYQARAIEDLTAWLKEQGDWVQLGAADESKAAGARMIRETEIERRRSPSSACPTRSLAEPASSTATAMSSRGSSESASATNRCEMPASTAADSTSCSR